MQQVSFTFFKRILCPVKSSKQSQILWLPLYYNSYQYLPVLLINISPIVLFHSNSNESFHGCSLGNNRGEQVVGNGPKQHWRAAKIEREHEFSSLKSDNKWKWIICFLLYIMVIQTNSNEKKKNNNQIGRDNENMQRPSIGVEGNFFLPQYKY